MMGRSFSSLLAPVMMLDESAARLSRLADSLLERGRAARASSAASSAPRRQPSHHPVLCTYSRLKRHVLPGCVAGPGPCKAGGCQEHQQKMPSLHSFKRLPM